MSAHSGHDNPQTGAGRPLPKKEADLFRSVLKYYEGKLYKKGVKAADQILRRYPNHGETLAMKGLTLNCMGKRDDAYDLVKRGLTNDMRSHVCWHVYGLLHRSDRNYNEAIKAYKQALRIDGENLQILRDLSLLQVQMRDLSGFLLTRNTILTQKPNNKIHWLAFALAKHLTGDRVGAVSVIDAYLGTLDDASPEKRRGFESSELALYRNMILGEIPGNGRAVLEDLERCKKVVVDRTAWLFAKAKTELCMGDHHAARATFLASFRLGSAEDYRMHAGYMCAVLGLDVPTCERALRLRGTDTVATMSPLTGGQRRTLLAAYRDELTPVLPTSHAVRRIPLTLLEGDDLRDAIDSYCRKDLSKGVPFLGKDLSSLMLVRFDAEASCPSSNGHVGTKEEQTKNMLTLGGSKLVRVKDPVDVRRHPLLQTIIGLIDGYILSLEATARYPDTIATNKQGGEVLEKEEDKDIFRRNGNENSDRIVEHQIYKQQEMQELEPPSTLLWSMYLRAHLHEMCGEYTEGLALIDKCIEHTPTAVDVYERKARLLKLSGAVESAAECLDRARGLDLQDRYINNKATKYLLRAGRDEEALERISLFTKHEGNPEQNLYDMQCAWYELELADCLARKGEWGRSLKKYMAVEKHFEDFHEDQFDFHSYCIRKVTLRAYVDVLRFEDNLWGHKFYRRAAEGIVKCYLHLHDHPESARGDAEEPDYSGMTAAERKKAKAIARKNRKKAERRKEAARGARRGDEKGENGQKNSKKKGGGGGSGACAGGGKADVVDQDPNGDQLLKRNPLDEMKKYVATLVNSAPGCFSTWILRYDEAMRRGKKVMALQALFKAKAIEPESSELFERTVDFAVKLSQAEDNRSSVDEVISSETAVLLGGKTVGEFVLDAVAESRNDPLTSLPMRITLAEALVTTKTGSTDEAASVIVDGGLDGRMASVPHCRRALLCLTNLGDAAVDAREKWVTQVTTKFPLMKDFS